MRILSSCASLICDPRLSGSTGRTTSVRGVQITRFREGKIVEHSGSSNELGILQQLGAMNGQEEEQDKGLVDRVKDKLSDR